MNRLILALAALLPLPAQAQQICSTRDAILAATATFHETPAAIGTHKSGQLFELLLSDQGGWTIIVTTGDRTCVVASGDGWEQHRLPGRDS